MENEVPKIPKGFGNFWDPYSIHRGVKLIVQALILSICGWGFGSASHVHMAALTADRKHQWPFQGLKMEVLYHIRPYVLGISPYIGLT
jgi:hypothetical protein